MDPPSTLEGVQPCNGPRPGALPPERSTPAGSAAPDIPQQPCSHTLHPAVAPQGRAGPFQTNPAWRWEQAGLLIESGRPLAGGEDPWLTKAVQFRQAIARGAASVELAAMADLVAAHAMYAGGGLQRDELEARLLAAESLGDIAVKCGISAGAVEAFAATFFCLPSRSTGYVVNRLLGLMPGSGQPFNVGQLVKYYGFAAGPAAVDVLVKALRAKEGEAPEAQETLRRARLYLADFVADPRDVEAAYALAKQMAAEWRSIRKRVSDLDQRRLTDSQVQLRVKLARLAVKGKRAPRKPQSPKQPESDNSKTPATPEEIAGPRKRAARPATKLKQRVRQARRPTKPSASRRPAPRP